MEHQIVTSDMVKAKKQEVVEEKTGDKIEKLSIDYPNEGINNIARKVNEIIERMYG